MSNIQTGRVFLVALIYAVIAQIIHSIGAMLSMSYYMLEEYWSVWSKLMMPAAGPPPVSFMVYSFIFSFIAGLFFAMVYNIVIKSIPGKCTAYKGLFYGFMVFLIAGLPSALSLILLINLPLILVLVWAVECLVIYLLIGMVTAKLIK